MKKTQLKIVLYLIGLFLPFSFCTPMSIAYEQHRLLNDSASWQPYTNILETSQPPAFLAGSFFERYTIPDPALFFIKSEVSGLGVFDLQTVAGQFSSLNFTESTRKIPLAAQPVLSTKVEQQVLAAFIVNPV
ncbi:hypothetical protein KAR10_03035, partial [bacterium]|nr:hypothetical protein [bacterium]